MCEPAKRYVLCVDRRCGYTVRDEASPYYDEDGHLITTAWKEKEKRERELEEKRLEQEEYQRQLQEANRRIAIDNLQAREEKKSKDIARRRMLRDEIIAMPQWVKDFPTTSLTAPPTMGKRELALYKITGKVTLTEQERARRERDLRNFSTAVQDYRNIHKKIPDGIPMIPVAIVGMSKNVGASMMTRSLSWALQESRRDMGSVAILDCGDRKNTLGDWFNISVRTTVIMKHIIQLLKSKPDVKYKLEDVFPRSQQGEYVLRNHKQDELRVDLTSEDIETLYTLLARSSGIALFDCDFNNSDSLLSCIALSPVCIFVFPAHSQAVEQSHNLMAMMRNNFGESATRDIISRAIFVISEGNSALHSDRGHRALKKLAEQVGTELHIADNRRFIIHYDEAIKHRPFSLQKTLFPTQHMIRVIAAMVIDTIIGEIRK